MSFLDFAALDAATLHREPFYYIVVPWFLKPEALDAVISDYPSIRVPGNLDLDGLEYGQAFQTLLDELDSAEFAEHIGRKFGIDLRACPKTVTVRNYCEPSDGNIHTDHWSKVITVLVYPNREWTHEEACLRLMRSKSDIEDYAVEVKPEYGTLLAFRRTGHSYHGHRRFEGERRMIQVNWLRSSKIARAVQQLDRFSTRMMKRVQRLAGI